MSQKNVVSPSVGGHNLNY